MVVVVVSFVAESKTVVVRVMPQFLMRMLAMASGPFANASLVAIRIATIA